MDDSRKDSMIKRAAILLIALVLVLAPAPGQGKVVSDIRVGLHPDHTRLVVDLDGPFSYRLEKPSSTRLLLVLTGARLKAGSKVNLAGRGVVTDLAAENSRGGVSILVNLTGPARINTFTWLDAHRLVVELSPKPGEPEPEKSPAETQANPVVPVEQTSPEPRPEQTETTPPAETEDQPETGLSTTNGAIAEPPDQTREAPVTEEPEPARTGRITEPEPLTGIEIRPPQVVSGEAELKRLAAAREKKPVKAHLLEPSQPGPPTTTNTAGGKISPEDALGHFLVGQKVVLPKPQKVTTRPEPKKEPVETTEEETSRLVESGPSPAPEAQGEVSGRIALPQPEALPREEEEPLSKPIEEQPPTTLGLTARIDSNQGRPGSKQSGFVLDSETEEEPQPGRVEAPIKSGPVVEEKIETRPGDERPGKAADKAQKILAETEPEEPQVLSQAELNSEQAEGYIREGLAQFKEGNYNDALILFEDAESLAPESATAEKALFYQGHSKYMLNKDTGYPPFDEVELAYQKAIGAFPRSQEVVKALLRMGVVNYDTGHGAKARGFFNIVINEHGQTPEAVEAKVYLARLFLDERRPQPAIRLLREVISKHPDSPGVKPALWYLGRVLFEIGRYVEGYQRLTTLLKGWPDFVYAEPMLLYYLGETAFRLDKMEEARGYLYRMINIAPEMGNQDIMLTRIGETFRLEKDYKQAAVLYTQAEKRFPETDGGLIAKIRLAETKGQKQGKAPTMDKVLGIETFVSAEKTYRGIMKKYPERPVAELAMLKLGALQYHQKKYQESFETLKALLLKYPGTDFYQDAVFALRQSFDRRMNQLAFKRDAVKLIEFYESFKDNLPGEIRSRYSLILGEAYFDLKLYAQAEIYFRDAARESPKDPKVMLGRALSEYHEGRYEPAAASMTRFLAAYPAHGRANLVRLLRGQALLFENQFEAAAKAFREAAEKGQDGPEYWPAIGYLAETQMAMGQHNQAIALLRKNLAVAPKKLPERQRLSILLGEALFATAKYQEAVQTLAQALHKSEVKGELLGGWYKLGQAQIAVGNMEEARQIMNNIVNSGDQFWAGLARDRLAVAELSRKMAAHQGMAPQ